MEHEKICITKLKKVSFNYKVINIHIKLIIEENK